MISIRVSRTPIFVKQKKKKPARRRILEINVGALDRIVDKAAQEPLNQEECKQLKTSIHAMAARLKKPPPRTTEKSKELLGGEDGGGGVDNTDSGLEGGKANEAPVPGQKKKTRRGGRGRNGAASYTGATQVSVAYGELTSKSTCSNCEKGKVYDIEPSPLIVIVGMSPIQATVYYLQNLRCNLCGEVYKAVAPEGVEDVKYDASVAAMVAQLHYGSGMPFTRIEKLQKQMGIPLPVGTQYDLVDNAAAMLEPVHDELIRLAAQGEVVTYDDTVARILDEVVRPEGQDESRTGLKTTGIVSQVDGRQIALFITGPEHAGENIGRLLKQREQGLPSLVGMADALSCNNPKVPPGVDLLMANCLTHGRRQFVDIFESFPDECRHVIEQLGLVYLHDKQAREQGLSAVERLSFHQLTSGPVMDELKKWMEAQLPEKTEPNSGLGKAIKYFLKRWDRLTLFLRHAGSPLDSNVVERALKRAILYRKNSFFYKTQHGAEVGDLFMSVIHTCDLNDVNSFKYMHQLQQHEAEVRASPAAWLPWNFHLQLRPAPD